MMPWEKWFILKIHLTREFIVYAGGLFGVIVGEEAGSYNSQRSVTYKLKQ